MVNSKGECESCLLFANRTGKGMVTKPMHRLTRKLAGLALLAGLFGAAVGPLAHGAEASAAAPAPSASATLERLKLDAFSALRRGEFDRTTQLLKQAASGSSDPGLELMASWVDSFNAQYEKTISGRKAEFDRAVAQCKFLQEKGHTDYALDALARAYALSIDKPALQQEQWVGQMVAAQTQAAQRYEAEGQWHKASRIYLSLGALEPANPLWKTKLKQAARYVRIQALYTPNQFKQLQKAREEIDEQVDALLASAGLKANSGKDQSGKSTTRPSEMEVVDAQLDWRDILKEIDADVVNSAIRDAVRNYYRDVDYQQVTIGGLEALRAFVTAPGIQTAFPTLDNDDQKSQFLKAVELASSEATGATPDDFSAFRDAFALIRKANEKTVRLPENALVYEFMDGAMAELDPFSGMIWPQQVEEFRTSTEGEFSGVGVQIERDESGALKVVSPIEDTPAYRAGIKAGDFITHVNGEYVKGILLDQAVKKIKGPTGSKVTLTVKSPDGGVKDYLLKRDTIKVASIKGWRHLPGGGWNWIIDPVQRVGYVRMTNFSKTTAHDLEIAFKQMEQEGVRGVILDLRANPGGLLTSAIEIADMFVERGTIVSTRADRKTAQPPSFSSADPDVRKIRLPMVVLVNQLSASASEIVSGALRDHGRALIVGERTYGKGSVQMLFPASRNSVLKLTTSHYYLPSGRCLHREENSTEWGVDPDFQIEMTPEQARAAMDARQEMDVLHAAGEQPTTAPVGGKGLLDVDPQLSAAVMLMRLQIAGANLQG